MAIPRQVHRSGPDAQYALTWNAMIDLCAMEPLEACSPIQRKAALLFWYQSEVNNGGHFQYFMNRPNYPHREVLALLRELGASRSAAAFNGALGRVESVLPLIAVDSESYLEREDQLDLNSFDTEWGIRGDEEVHACLSALLRENESEFVQWLPS
jgi:hypothetical protein